MGAGLGHGIDPEGSEIEHMDPVMEYLRSGIEYIGANMSFSLKHMGIHRYCGPNH